MHYVSEKLGMADAWFPRRPWRLAARWI